jgi:Fe-S oxidoreductase
MLERTRKWNIIDRGLEEGVKGLSPERIERVINQVLDGEGKTRVKVYVDTCIHCRLCSTACHYYLSNDCDPYFSPVGKVKETLWEILKKKGKVTLALSKKRLRLSILNVTFVNVVPYFVPLG